MGRVFARWFGNLIPFETEPGSAVWFFRRDRAAMFGLILMLLVILAAICAPALTPYVSAGLGEPDVANKLLAPQALHPFGTDSLGRDLLARVLFGEYGAAGRDLCGAHRHSPGRAGRLLWRLD